MTVALDKAQLDWVEAQVAAGRFASIDEAVQATIARLQADEAIDDAWVAPLLHEAIVALDRGDGEPWRKGEILERIKARRTTGS